MVDSGLPVGTRISEFRPLRSDGGALARFGFQHRVFDRGFDLPQDVLGEHTAPEVEEELYHQRRTCQARRVFKAKDS